MNATFSVEGIDKTIKALARYNIAFYDSSDGIVRKYTRQAVSRAKDTAPVATGNLKASIKAKYFKMYEGPASTVFPRGKKGVHRHLVEYGTGPRTAKNGGSRGSMRANAFMARATDPLGSPYLAEMRALVNKDVYI